MSTNITKLEIVYSFRDSACESNFIVVRSKVNYRTNQKMVATLIVAGKIIKVPLQLEFLIQVPLAFCNTVLPQRVIRPIYFDFDKYKG